MSAFENAAKRLVKRLSAWAWKDEIEARYTPEEVASWLSFYHGRYREVPMTDWIKRQRRAGR